MVPLDPTRCQPGGHPLECDCGEPLRLVPTENGQDWKHVDQAGRSHVDQAPPLLRSDPKRWWDELFTASPETYSVLSAAVAVGYWSWWHVHRPAPCPPGSQHVRLAMPEHCGEPAWLGPMGWRCRACKTPIETKGETP